MTTSTHDGLGPRITIDRTWDGAPLARTEIVSLVLSSDRDGLRLTVAAPYHGDPPPPAPSGSTEGLWEHEVVELFIAAAAHVAAQPAYLEVEIGPHGHFLLLRHEGVRQRVGVVEPVSVATAIDGNCWSGEMVVARRHLPPTPWLGNAYAIHGIGTERRYLAASRVPGEAPDFHQPRCFPPLAAV